MAEKFSDRVKKDPHYSYSYETPPSPAAKLERAINKSKGAAELSTGATKGGAPKIAARANKSRDSHQKTANKIFDKAMDQRFTKVEKQTHSVRNASRIRKYDF